MTYTLHEEREPVFIFKLAGQTVRTFRLIGDETNLVPNACAQLYDDGRVTIHLNDAMLLLGKKYIRAAVAHELGHIAHRHFGDERTLEKEFQADVWAARNIGGRHVLRLLDKLLDVLAGFDIHDEELAIRADALEQAMAQGLA